jgi:hypothetical protein
MLTRAIDDDDDDDDDDDYDHGCMSDERADWFGLWIRGYVIYLIMRLA